jgi:hypothetical protein
MLARIAVAARRTTLGVPDVLRTQAIDLCFHFFAPFSLAGVVLPLPNFPKMVLI